MTFSEAIFLELDNSVSSHFSSQTHFTAMIEQIHAQDLWDADPREHLSTHDPLPWPHAGKCPNIRQIVRAREQNPQVSKSRSRNAAQWN